jgi:hypothetical protein
MSLVRATVARSQLRVAAPVLLIIAVVVAALGGAPASAHPSPRAVPADLTAAINAGKAALTKAQGQIHTHHMLKAADTLASLRRQLTKADTAAKQVIAHPPSDPEGNPALSQSIVALLAFEHQVVLGLYDEFDGKNNTTIIAALDTTLAKAMTIRNPLIDTAIDLSSKPAGEGLADDMPDTLPLYAQEVTRISAELDTAQLIPSARTALTDTLNRATVTKAKMDDGFGGGE